MSGERGKVLSRLKWGEDEKNKEKRKKQNWLAEKEIKHKEVQMRRRQGGCIPSVPLLCFPQPNQELIQSGLL